MLNVFATATSTTQTTSTRRPRCRRIRVDSPMPLPSPSRAAVSWTAAAMTPTIGIDHSRVTPYAAPTCEYVPIPEGSSSAAPVTMPGPRRLK